MCVPLPVLLPYRFACSCDAAYKAIGAFSILGRAAVLGMTTILLKACFLNANPAVFTLRTYAVWGANKMILAILVPIALACVALDCVSIRSIFPESFISDPSSVPNPRHGV